MRVISADSHVLDRPEDVAQYAKMIDIAGWPEQMENHRVKIPSMGVFPVDSLCCAGRDMDLEHGVPQRASYDATARGKILEEEDVDAEILYPGIGMLVLGCPDRTARRTYARAYNHYIADFALKDPRLHGLGMASLTGSTAGLDEVAQCLELGLKGIILPGNPETDLHVPSMDPFWRMCAETGLIVHFHVLTGEEHLGDQRGPLAAAFYAPVQGVQNHLSTLIWGGVFDRHPDLQVVFAEAEVGWVDHWVERATRLHSYKFAMFHGGQLKREPWEYIQNNCWFTFTHLEHAVQRFTRFGYQFMWGSDYPHLDSCYPDSQFVLRQIDENAKGGNAARLYGL